MEQLTLLLMLAGVGNRLLEVIKKLLGDMLPFEGKAKESLWLSASMVMGLILVFASQTDRHIFTGITVLQTLEPTVARIIAGILVGGGSNAIHGLINVVSKAPNDVTTSTMTTTHTESVPPVETKTTWYNSDTRP